MTPENRNRGTGEEFQVKRKAVAVNVFDIQLQAVTPCRPISAVNMSQPGSPGRTKCRYAAQASSNEDTSPNSGEARQGYLSFSTFQNSGSSSMLTPEGTCRARVQSRFVLHQLAWANALPSWFGASRSRKLYVDDSTPRSHADQSITHPMQQAAS
jgi:hypothetical protein